jgi:hypothetical protein
MSQSALAAEDELCRAYEQQAAKYEAVLQLSEQVARAFAEGGDAYEGLRQLNGLLDQIARLDVDGQALRSRWETLLANPSSRLRQILERLERLIRGTIDQINRAEHSARQARDRLLPELRHEALARQMQQTYSQYHSPNG